MDNPVLKKKLSTFKSPTGQVRDVSPEVLLEVLRAWENWSGQSKVFYQSIGLNRKQGARIVGVAKKLLREGALGAPDFTELKVGELFPGVSGSTGVNNPCSAIELSWEGGRVIRFPQVEQLLDFLKKVAA